MFLYCYHNIVITLLGIRGVWMNGCERWVRWGNFWVGSQVLGDYWGLILYRPTIGRCPIRRHQMLQLPAVGLRDRGSDGASWICWKLDGEDWMHIVKSRSALKAPVVFAKPSSTARWSVRHAPTGIWWGERYRGEIKVVELSGGIRSSIRNGSDLLRLVPY